nr:uncharacterized protein LOC106028313 [Cavia porcellus]
MAAAWETRRPAVGVAEGRGPQTPPASARRRQRLSDRGLRGRAVRGAHAPGSRCLRRARGLRWGRDRGFRSSLLPNPLPTARAKPPPAFAAAVQDRIQQQPAGNAPPKPRSRSLLVERESQAGFQLAGRGVHQNPPGAWPGLAWTPCLENAQPASYSRWPNGRRAPLWSRCGPAAVGAMRLLPSSRTAGDEGRGEVGSMPFPDCGQNLVKVGGLSAQQTRGWRRAADRREPAGARRAAGGRLLWPGAFAAQPRLVRDAFKPPHKTVSILFSLLVYFIVLFVL